MKADRQNLKPKRTSGYDAYVKRVIEDLRAEIIRSDRTEESKNLALEFLDCLPHWVIRRSPNAIRRLVRRLETATRGTNVVRYRRADSNEDATKPPIQAEIILLKWTDNDR